ncbi:hypothetical protein D3C85_1526860 [compost metagenome]
MLELVGQYGRRGGDLAVFDFFVGRPDRHFGEIGQAGGMVPVGVGEQDAVDADAVAVELVAYRGDRAVAQQRLVVPGHLRFELLVDLAAQRGIEQQGGGMVLDQHGDMVGDDLLAPGAILDGESVAGCGLGGLDQGEA